MLVFTLGLVTWLIERICILNVENVNVVWTVFVFLCGQLVVVKQRMQVNPFVRNANYAYFEMKLGGQANVWAPLIISKTCVEILCHWRKGLKTMHFGIPMIWHESKNHVEDRYSCITPAYGFNKKSNIKYNIPT